MAENRNINTGGRGSNTFLGFVIGAVVLAVAIVAYFMFADDGTTTGENASAPTTSAPATPGGGGAGAGGGTAGGAGGGGAGGTGGSTQ